MIFVFLLTQGLAFFIMWLLYFYVPNNHSRWQREFIEKMEAKRKYADRKGIAIGTTTYHYESGLKKCTKFHDANGDIVKELFYNYNGEPNRRMG